MSAGPVIGITGDVVLPSGFNLRVQSGSMVISIVEIDVTNTSTSAGCGEGVGGVRKARGTAVGIPSTGGAGLQPGFSTIPTGNTQYVPSAMTYKVNGTTCTYTFNALITNIRHGFTYQGKAAISFDFSSSGSITETWG